MADFNLDIVIKAHDQATAIFNRAQSSAEKFGARIQASVGNFVSFRAAAIAGTAALAGFTYAMVTSIKAAGEAEAAEARLVAVLKSTGMAAGMTKEEILNLSSSLQGLTTFEDDAVTSASALMLTFTKVNREVFPDAIKLAADLSIGMGQDLQASVVQVGKALQDPISGITALRRVGVQLSETQEKQIKGFMATNNLASAQKIILGELATQFGGQAEATAATFGGRLTQLKNSFGDLQEEIGFVITKNDMFIKATELAQKVLERMATWVKTNRLELMGLAQGAMVWVIQSIGFAVRVLEAFQDGWYGLRLVAQAVLLAMVDTVNVLYNALRLVLNPLDVIYDGMVKLGLAESNPFERWQDSINEFRGSVVSSGAELLDKIDNTKNKYGEVKAEIAGIVTQIKSWKAEQAGVAPTPPQTAAGVGAVGGAEDKTVKSAAISPPQQDAHMTAYQQELDFQGLVQGSYTGHYSKLVELNAQYGKQITEQELSKARTIEYLSVNTFGMMSNMMQNLTVLAGKEGGAAFKAMKAFAIAETLIQTYRAAMGSYAALAPIPIVGPALGVAAAAAAVVAGLARVKQISSMEPGGSASGSTVSAGGSASPSYSGGSPSAYPSPQRAEEKQAQNITVIINNPLADENWDRIVQDNIVPAINAAGERNVKISLRAVEAN